VIDKNITSYTISRLCLCTAGGVKYVNQAKKLGMCNANSALLTSANKPQMQTQETSYDHLK